jgi:hypothetical protein
MQIQIIQQSRKAATLLEYCYHFHYSGEKMKEYQIGFQTVFK